MVDPMKIGDIITFDELDKIIGAESRLCRGAIYRASKELMKKSKRMLVPERGEGYQLVEGMDMYLHAEERHTKAEKQVKMAGYEASHVDTVKLTPDQRNKLNNFLVGNREIAIALASNVKAIENGVQATRTQLTGIQTQVTGAEITQLFTEEQVRKLKELLGDK